MKNQENIIKEIDDNEKLLKKKEICFNSLNQIDCLSGEGSTLRKEINKLKGKIEALKWVIL
jgi:hypothetical protein